MTSLPISVSISLAVLAVGLLASISDVRARRIPNLLTGTAMLIGLTLHLIAGGWSELVSSLAALGLCGAAFLMVYLAGGMGAGDVKLIAAEGALLGLSNALPLLALTAIAGGVLAVLYAGWHGRLRQTCRNVLALILHHSSHGLDPHPEFNMHNSATLRLPYALAIAAGSVGTLGFQMTRGHV